MKVSQHKEQLEAHIVYIMLLRSGRYTYLPELFDAVGKEKMLEVLQLFAGMQIKFPTMDEIKRYAKEVTIFFRINKVSEKQRASVVKDLADEYIVDEDTINLIYQQMSHLLKDELLLRL